MSEEVLSQQGDAGGEVATPPAPDPNVSAVASIAEEFKRALAEARTTNTPPAPAPPQPDRNAAIEKYNRAREEVNALAAEGKVFEANELHMRAVAELQAVQSAPQGNLEDHPAVKSQVEIAHREVKRDNPEAFSRWGKEIEAEINSMPVASRILPSAWEAALQSVKARHIDEIVADEVKKRTAAMPPSAPGSRGNVGAGGDTTDLSEVERMVAKGLGVDAATYRKERETLKGYSDGQGIWRAPILSDDVQPGKF